VSVMQATALILGGIVWAATVIWLVTAVGEELRKRSEGAP